MHNQISGAWSPKQEPKVSTGTATVRRLSQHIALSQSHCKANRMANVGRAALHT